MPKNVPFSLGNEKLGEVKEYNYLGQMARADPSQDSEIRLRIGMGWGALGKSSENNEK